MNDLRGNVNSNVTKYFLKAISRILSTNLDYYERPLMGRIVQWQQTVIFMGVDLFSLGWSL